MDRAVTTMHWKGESRITIEQQHSFYGRHQELVDRYKISISQVEMDLAPLPRCLSYLYHRKDFYRTWLWVTTRICYKTQGLINLRLHLSSSPFFLWGGGRWSMLLTLFSFLYIVLYAFVSWFLSNAADCVFGLFIADWLLGFLWNAFESGAVVYHPLNQNRIIEYLCRASFLHQLRNGTNIQMASKPDIFN